jgi:transcriptional antiterminator NusG
MHANDIPEEAKWYVVHTYSGYENKVKANLEKIVENRNMQDYILDIVVPMEEQIEIKDGKKKATLRKVFPGYVLIKMIMTDDSWYVVRNTRGVTGFVGPGYKVGSSRPGGGNTHACFSSCS